MTTTLLDRPSPQPVDDLTRRELITGLTAAGLLAACGRGPGDPADQQTAIPTRIFRDAFGEVTLPSNPERIVSLIPSGGVDYFLTLGLVPVGSTHPPGAQSALPLWYRDGLFPLDVSPDEIVMLGTPGEPNLERMATLDPDVIVGWSYHVEDRQLHLKAIAPTVGLSLTNGPQWREALGDMARALGREQQAAEFDESWETALQRWRGRVKSSMAGATVSVLWTRGGNAAYYTDRSQPGSIVVEAGFSLPRPSFSSDPEESGGELSPERLPEVDADVIFLMTPSGTGDREMFDKSFGANPLWRRLKAVQNDMVFPVDLFLWTNGGPTGNREVLLPDLFAPFV